MSQRYYISTKELSNNEYLYGILKMVDEKPSDYSVGTISGNILEVNETLTKKMMEQNKESKEPFFTFKYDSLDIARHMGYMFDKNREFVQYSRMTHIGLESSPSIFLSDLTNLRPLKQRMTVFETTLKNNVKNFQKS